MVNDCLRLCVQSGDYSYESVKLACFPRMREYQIHDAYRVSAMYEASNLLKKFRTDSRRKKINPPRCRNFFISASLGVWLEDGDLRLPELGKIPMTNHSLSELRQQGVSITSVTLTPRTCSVIYRKPVEMIVPTGMVGIDLNLDNITSFDTSGSTNRYDIGALAEIHETYRRVKSRFRRRDRRIKRNLFRKYADIEWDRKNAIMHEVSRRIVDNAFEKRLAIVLEDLRGLREMYRKESGNSSYYLSKMNAWPFWQILHRIAYKAEWRGIPVHVISPEWTSEKCSSCGGRMADPPVDGDDVVCLSCGLVIDRDLNGAKNILRRGLRSRPGGSAGEAMMGGQVSERRPNPGADADHPTSHDK
ncbi:MAG: transposase [Thaumarchaeota archaeon]|nr:transposase [Nitrososphaerota archaeon]